MPRRELAMSPTHAIGPLPQLFEIRFQTLVPKWSLDEDAPTINLTNNDRLRDWRHYSADFLNTPYSVERAIVELDRVWRVKSSNIEFGFETACDELVGDPALDFQGFISECTVIRTDYGSPKYAYLDLDYDEFDFSSLSLTLTPNQKPIS